MWWGIFWMQKESNIDQDMPNSLEAIIDLFSYVWLMRKRERTRANIFHPYMFACFAAGTLLCRQL